METESLIRKAFEMASRMGQGQPTMTAAVLKNRMLQLSDGTFDEKTLGYVSFTAFLNEQSNLVEIDRSTKPPMVRLVGRLDEEHNRPISNLPVRIRPDLWRAVMDYSTGQTYVWDLESKEARPSREGDSERMKLPTFTISELHEIRGEFRDRHFGQCTESERIRLDVWAQKDLNTGALPPRFRGLWNEVQKKSASDKLRAWFKERELTEPQNVEQPIIVSEERGRGDDIRGWVHSVVGKMTDAELKALLLPVAACMRVLR